MLARRSKPGNHGTASERTRGTIIQGEAKQLNESAEELGADENC
jgi:hypothetical protein